MATPAEIEAARRELARRELERRDKARRETAAQEQPVVAPRPARPRPARAVVPVAAPVAPVAAPAPAPVPAPTPAPARPVATVPALAERAAALRLSGQPDKAMLVERQIDAIRAREKKQAEEKEAEVKAAESLAKGRDTAASANITARETDAPTRTSIPLDLPETELALIPTPGSLAQALDVQRVAEERAQETSTRRGLPVSETAALIELEREQERERRARTVSAGGVVDEGPSPITPFLRPTRIQEVPRALLEEPEVQEDGTFGESIPFGESEQGQPVTGTVRAYRDPSTGKYSLPTAGQEFVEAFARQPVMSESDALAFALEQTDASPESKSALRNVLTQRVPGQGIVETPLGASLRAVGALAPAFVNTALIGPLLFAADVETTRGAPVAFGADPTAKRKVSRAGEFENFEDLFAEYAQGLQQGRGIGDELAQIPALVKATAKASGENEEWARNALWATGTLSELFLPVTPAGLPGKAAQAAKLGATAAGGAAKLGTKVAARVAPATTAAAIAKAGAAQRAAGAVVDAATAPVKAAAGAVRDRALLGTIAKRTYPEVASDIPRLASEDEIIRVLQSKGRAGLGAGDDARAILRAQVPDNLVQISDSVAARKGVASQLLADAQAEVKLQTAARSLTPAEASTLLDDILVAKTKAGKPGLKLMDELTVRSLSPVPPGVEPGYFDGIVARTFAALAKDVLKGAVRPDNALAAALYKRVQGQTFRATQNLRDEIVDLAKEVNRQNPSLTRAEAKDKLLEEIFNKYIAPAPDGYEKLLDKIVEDGLGRIGDTNVTAAAKTRLEELVKGDLAYAQAMKLPPPPRDFATVLKRMERVATKVGLPTKSGQSLTDRLLVMMAATIIEDIQKAAVVGDAGAIMPELARLQRGRTIPFPDFARVESATPSGALVAPQSALGDSWATGAEAAFRTADMFEPKALNAAWYDSLTNALQSGAQLSKRFKLYISSQLGPIPNAPAWLDRFIRGAVTSAAQIGLSRTGVAAQDAMRFRFAPGNAVLFTGADGIQWTKDLIKSEGRRVGLGLSAQDSARQGLANEVLIDRVNRQLEGARQRPAGPSVPRAKLAQMDSEQAARAVRALVGPDYAAMAGAASDAYREAVFAGALRNGMTIDQAAQVARRSLLDYSLTPTGGMYDTITKYFASAAETYGGMVALADTLRRNPSLPMNALRMQNGLNRTRDPLGVMGDESKRALLSLPIGPNEYELMVGANPVVWALEGVLGTIGAIDAGVVGVGEVFAGDQPVLDELGDVAGAGLRLAGGTLLGELEPRTPTASAPSAGVLTDAELLGLLLHLSAPDGQHPEWRPLIDTNFPRKIVAPPQESALASEEGYKDLGPLRIWKQIPRDWAKKGLVWERISPEEAEVIVQRYPNLAENAPTFIRVYALEPEGRTLLRGIRGRSQGVFDDAARYYASAKAAEEGREGTVGIPASTEDPTRVLIEAVSRRGVTEPGEAEKKTVEALRATRAGE